MEIMNRQAKNIGAIFGAAAAVATAFYLALRPITYPREDRSPAALQDEAKSLFRKKGYQPSPGLTGKFPDETRFIFPLRKHKKPYTGEAGCRPQQPCRLIGDPEPVF
jgi:hypothetical protein